MGGLDGWGMVGKACRGGLQGGIAEGEGRGVGVHNEVLSALAHQLPAAARSLVDGAHSAANHRPGNGRRVVMLTRGPRLSSVLEIINK